MKLLSPKALQSNAVGTQDLREHTQAGPRFGANTAAIKSQLKDATVAKRRELLVELVRQQAMKTLGITETIDVTRPLREFGLDSLMSVTLVNRLESALGIKISAVKLIQGPSVEQLVNEIIPELPA